MTFKFIELFVSHEDDDQHIRTINVADFEHWDSLLAEDLIHALNNDILADLSKYIEEEKEVFQDEEYYKKLDNLHEQMKLIIKDLTDNETGNHRIVKWFWWSVEYDCSFSLLVEVDNNFEVSHGTEE